MTDYRRNFLAGGRFFFTVNLAERRLRLLTKHIDKLRDAFRETRRHPPFTIDAIVVLPDHLHTVWALPEGDANFATRWRLIKSAFSRRLATGERVSESRAAKGERGIWQRCYWEHTIRDDNDLARHVDYLHSYQPGQAPACGAGQGLAVFVVPSHGARIGQATSRMTAGFRRTAIVKRSKPMGFAKAQPILRANLRASTALGPAPALWFAATEASARAYASGWQSAAAEALMSWAAGSARKPWR